MQADKRIASMRADERYLEHQADEQVRTNALGSELDAVEKAVGGQSDSKFPDPL